MELRIDSAARLCIENALFTELNKLNILHLFGERFKDFSPNEELVKQLDRSPSFKAKGYTQRMRINQEKMFNCFMLDRRISEMENLITEGFEYIDCLYCFVTDLEYGEYDVDMLVYVTDNQ